MDRDARLSGDRNMPSVLDKELSELSSDAFGHRYFAEALRSLVEGGHRPPYSIGLLGSWGTGKSTIKELYLASLLTDNSGSTGNRRKDRFRPVTFNAWRYGGDDNIKRALLRHVFLQLGGDDVELHRHLHQQVSGSAQQRKGFWEWLKEATLQNVTSVALFIALFTAIMAMIWGASHGLGLTSQWGLTIVLSVGMAVATFLSKYVVDVRIKSPTLFNKQTVISFPATSAEEYERLLVEQIKKFRASRNGRSCERLIVFVDDLDRLSAAEMVAGLDAVRTFLELPFGKQSEDFGVIFVISCDEDRVADALSRGRGRVNLELPASVFTRSDARRYLDRLFQFRLEIPPFPKLDMRQFTEKKLRGLNSVADQIEKRGLKLQDVVERLIHVGVQSPRNAIQILNAFAQTWWIAVQRERNGIGSSEPGVLHDGAVSNHPLALAALCVLRVDFPDFYHELQLRPELIQEFNRVVFRNEDFESLAVAAQHALKDFLVIQDGKTVGDVRAEHRMLRQYLSSLLDLRWPKSLQPLLLLAQDTISRKYGDRAAELNDAFVSGDTRGVLEVFGHHLDSDNLGREDIRLLEELTEGLSDDTHTRRVNAARVLADIVDRIPGDSRQGLMVPLARQMIDLRDIRTNVGPESAKHVIASLAGTDRREVAERFSADLLTGTELQWRLPTGETPNLEELISDVKSAVDLVLDVRATDQLLPPTDSRLRAWLLARDVRSGQGAQTLPFAELERWMDQHEEHLLPLLGKDYTRLAVEELESRAERIPNKEQMLQRVSLVFSWLASEGQESREELWQQLSKLAALRDKLGVSTAWTEAGRSAALATRQQAQTFLIALSGRLLREMEDEDNWGLDWKAGAQQFLDLVTRWEGNLDRDTASAILPLAKSWGEVGPTAGYMARIADVFAAHEREVWNELVGFLVGKTFGDLPWISLEYLAMHLPEIDEENKITLTAQLDQFVNLDEVDADIAGKYRDFVAAVPENEWSSAPLVSHTKTSRARLLAMSTDANYLSAIFPSARMLFRNAPKGQLAAVLPQLFEQAAGSPDAYPILHREMKGNWPSETERTGSYDPGSIASRAMQFIEENPSLSGSGDVFKSVVDMVSTNLVGEDIEDEVSGAATSLWPHSPAPVAESGTQIAPFMLSADVRKILTGNQPPDPELKYLQTLVAALTTEDESRCLEIAIELLAVAPKQLDERPDGALSIWLSSLGDKKPGVLRALLDDQELNESQRERVVAHALVERKQLGLTFFVEAVPIILARPGEAKPLGRIISRIDDIVSLATKSGQKSTLAMAFIAKLPELSGEPLATIARAVHQLNGKGILERNTEVLDKMDAAQLQIVEQEIGGSKIIARYLDTARKADEE